ncbi:MAG TPA: hypothetical protein VEV38_03330 [Candidatus Eremiobacteraceae bacterium]|nr:hypothetical protein [Candidatus Eremiobacteraceae bacterium]
MMRAALVLSLVATSLVPPAGASAHSEWDPICMVRTPASSPGAPGAVPYTLRTPEPDPMELWPHFLRPTKSDYDSKHLSLPMRDKVGKIVGRLPKDERQNARWMSYQGDLLVFEVTPNQFCDGRGTLMSPVINRPGLFVDPSTGEATSGP